MPRVFIPPRDSCAVPVQDLEDKQCEHVIKSSVNETRQAAPTSSLQRLIDDIPHPITEENAFDIYERGCLLLNTIKTCPTAPSEDESEEHHVGLKLRKFEEVLKLYRNDCLKKIDEKADKILLKENPRNLSLKDVLRIIKRDTLKLESETSVYVFAMKYLDAKCTSGVVDTIVLEIMRSVRFGLFSYEEFTQKNIAGFKGPRRSGYLTEREIESIEHYIMQRKAKRPTYLLEHDWSKARTEKNYKVTKHKRSSDQVLINLLSCWITVFD